MHSHIVLREVNIPYRMLESSSKTAREITEDFKLALCWPFS